jgi:hypothetical protein
VINPEMKSSAGRGFYVLSGPAGRVLPALVDVAWPEGES